MKTVTIPKTIWRCDTCGLEAEHDGYGRKCPACQGSLKRTTAPSEVWSV